MIFAFEFICDEGKWYSPESHKKDLKNTKRDFDCFTRILNICGGKMNIPNPNEIFQTSIERLVL